MTKELEALDTKNEKLCSITNSICRKSIGCKNCIRKSLKALEIIKKYPGRKPSLQNFRYMTKYWEENNKKITKELLEVYDFPFEIEEYDLLKEVLE